MQPTPGEREARQCEAVTLGEGVDNAGCGGCPGSPPEWGNQGRRCQFGGEDAGGILLLSEPQASEASSYPSVGCTGPEREDAAAGPFVTGSAERPIPWSRPLRTLGEENLRPPVDDRRNAADATEATVVLTCEDGMLRVLVRDDGRGGTQMPQLPVAATTASSASPNASPSSTANCTPARVRTPVGRPWPCSPPWGRARGDSPSEAARPQGLEQPPEGRRAGQAGARVPRTR